LDRKEELKHIKVYKSRKINKLVVKLKLVWHSVIIVVKHVWAEKVSLIANLVILMLDIIYMKKMMVQKIDVLNNVLMGIIMIQLQKIVKNVILFAKHVKIQLIAKHVKYNFI